MIIGEHIKENTHLESIEEFKIIIKRLNDDLNITLKESSWIHEALSFAETAKKHDNAGTYVEYTRDGATRWNVSTAFVTIAEFNFVMSSINILLQQDKNLIKKKIRNIVGMPFKVLDEDADTSTNRGRNDLFELRLALRFCHAGYETILSEDHPDLLVKTARREYAIECKRLFSSKSFEKRTKEAIYQLENYSLNKGSRRYGLVAISITRAFHRGDMKLYAETPKMLGELADNEITKFADSNMDFIHEIFPRRIPGILLDFSDIAESSKPYWLHWLQFIETASRRELSYFNMVQKDFSNMNPL